jgi:hypothetical protein
MKLCKDCRWCSSVVPDVVRGIPDEARFWRCGHADALFRQVDPVTGETIEFQMPCHSARSDSSNCGPDGKNWAAAAGFV